MEQIRQKNMAALGTLYTRYAPLVSGAIVATVPFLARNDVEDIAQDVFLAVNKASASYVERGKLRAWLYSIATRVARRRSRSVGIFNRIRRTLTESSSGGLRPRESGSETAVAARIDLLRALERLSPVQRQVLVLFEYQGMSGDEISEILGLSLNTVWSHLRRARGKLLDWITRDNAVGEGRP